MKIAMLVLAALTSGVAAPAAVTPSAHAAEASIEHAPRALPSVTVVVRRGERGIEVEGRCRLRAMPAAAWAVLTDYEDLERFVSSMRDSRVTARDSGYVLVEQAAVGRVFLFSRRMRTVLKVREEPPARIDFEDVLKRDFASYRGAWRIEDFGNEVEIVYELEARPTFRVPDAVARNAFQRAVRELIGQVGAEIEIRAEEAGVSGLSASKGEGT